MSARAALAELKKAAEMSVRKVPGTALAAVRSLADETGRHVRAKLPKIYSHELVNVIFELPCCRIADESY